MERYRFVFRRRLSRVPALIPAGTANTEESDAVNFREIYDKKLTVRRSSDARVKIMMPESIAMVGPGDALRIAQAHRAFAERIEKTVVMSIQAYQRHLDAKTTDPTERS